MIKLEKGDDITVRSNDGIMLTITYDPAYDGKNVTYSEECHNIMVKRGDRILIDNISKVNKF